VSNDELRRLAASHPPPQAWFDDTLPELTWVIGPAEAEALRVENLGADLAARLQDRPVATGDPRMLGVYRPVMSEVCDSDCDSEADTGEWPAVAEPPPDRPGSPM